MAQQKPVVKKTTTKKSKTVSERIGDISLRDIKNAGEDALQIATLGGYGKVKKALGGEYKHKKIGERKNGGKVTKAKNGKSFPDLNKDGKITKADILKGRGVIAKKGATVMKAQKGKKVKKTTTVTNPISKKLKINPKAKVELANPLMPPKYSPGFDIKAKTGTKMKKCKYGCN